MFFLFSLSFFNLKLLLLKIMFYNITRGEIMASSFMKKFAIENNLTIDYGYTYGKYRDLYFSIKDLIILSFIGLV